MKKIFIEPELIRIDLKMTEKIAASNPYNEYGDGFLSVLVKEAGNACYDVYVETNPEIKVVPNPVITMDFLNALYMGQCFKNSAARAMAYSAYGLR